MPLLQRLRDRGNRPRELGGEYERTAMLDYADELESERRAGAQQAIIHHQTHIIDVDKIRVNLTLTPRSIVMTITKRDYDGIVEFARSTLNFVLLYLIFLGVCSHFTSRERFWAAESRVHGRMLLRAAAEEAMDWYMNVGDLRLRIRRLLNILVLAMIVGLLAWAREYPLI